MNLSITCELLATYEISFFLPPDYQLSPREL